MKMYSEYRAQARETLKGRWNEMALLMLLIGLIAFACETPSFIGSLFDMLWLVPYGSGMQVLAAMLLTVPLYFALCNLLLIYSRGETPEDSYLEQQIIDVLNQYVSENSGYQVNDNALAQIHENAKVYDSLVKDQHYLMKTEITEDRACVVQFTTEQGKVMTTYTFFKAVISEDSKK